MLCDIFAMDLFNWWDFHFSWSMVNGGREPARALVCRLYRENLQVEVGGPVDARVDRQRIPGY